MLGAGGRGGRGGGESFFKWKEKGQREKWKGWGGRGTKDK